VCITTNQPNTNANPNPTTKQHWRVNTPQNIVECSTYSEKFIRDTVDAPFVPTSIVIVTLPRCTGKEPDTCTTHFVDSNHLTSRHACYSVNRMAAMPAFRLQRAVILWTRLLDVSSEGVRSLLPVRTLVTVSELTFVTKTKFVHLRPASRWPICSTDFPQLVTTNIFDCNVFVLWGAAAITACTVVWAAA